MPVTGQTAAGVTVPDTKLAREATDAVRAAATDLVHDHSRRVDFRGSLQALQPRAPAMTPSCSTSPRRNTTWADRVSHGAGHPGFMEPEVALVTAGVECDVLGIGYRDILHAFTEGIGLGRRPPSAPSRMLWPLGTLTAWITVAARTAYGTWTGELPR
jgi:hypothetical protein